MSTIDQRQVPSLTLKGWITTVPEKLDALLNYYFLSDHSQSDWYNIFSLPYHVATKGNNPQEIRNLMKNDLEQYFTRYFGVVGADGTTQSPPTVTVDVIDKTPTGADIARYEIQTEIIVVVDGVKYSAGKAIQVLNSNITILDRLNNG